MSGLMFPKQQTKKKRKRHLKSIMQDKDGTCFLCKWFDDNYYKPAVVQEHHIFGGPNRKYSEATGLKVYLCLSHHLYGKEAAHSNKEIMRLLHQEGQRAFERNNTREEFVRIFGKNYLEAEDE